MTGLFLVDKQAGPTSFGVLRGLRPALGDKLGHAGTLDPFATGLLLVLAGPGTRLATYLSGLDKRYTAVVQLGATSSTLDPEGDVELTGRQSDEAAVRAALPSLTGSVEQRVPLASAVRVAGERSYRRMRRGVTDAPPPRTVHIERLDVIAFDHDRQQVTIDVECSKGTYVRQLAADLGEAVGAGGYCLELRRAAIGPFVVEHAGTPEQIAADPSGPWRLDLREALPHLPERVLADEELDDVRHGRRLSPRGETGPVRLVHHGDLAAIGEPGDRGIRPVVVLAR
ncbi:MAG: tRNA pseudouridine55 synthase [Gaiellales bacterium]|nr:tRNA pseudouridine55 synthase [Gaiellales bacterium]